MKHECPSCGFVGVMMEATFRSRDCGCKGETFECGCVLTEGLACERCAEIFPKSPAGVPIPREETTACAP